MASNSSRNIIGPNIIQLNLGKHMNASKSLLQGLGSSTICAIQEPFIRNNRIPCCPKSHKQFIPTCSSRPRVALVLPADLARNTMVLGTFSSADCIVVRVKLNRTTNLLLASIYMDIDHSVPVHLVTRICNQADADDIPLIVGTDSNAHHTAWGHRDCNTRGRNLLPCINSNNLVIVNSGSSPTFQGHLGSSCIDLTLVNERALRLVQDWRVDSYHSTSDHNSIMFNLDLEAEEYVVNRSIKRCDWSLFSQLVEQRFKNHPFWFKPVYTQTDLNNRQNFISDILTDCFNTACPIIRGKIKSTAPWWSTALNQEKRQVRKLRRRAHRTNLPDDWGSWKSADKRYTTSINQARNLGWKNFCSDIEGASATARISKILNYNSSDHGELHSIRQSNGELTNSPTDTLTALATELIPADGVLPQGVMTSPDHVLINRSLAPHRLDRAVKQLSKNKAPGPDGIRNNMIISAWPWIKSAVRNIFYNCLILGSSPSAWWENTGVLLAKPNKSDYSNPRAFRIISLTAGFQKLLERLILWDLEQHHNISVRLTNNQHGFRKGASTESAIHNLSRRVEDAVNRGDYALGVFLDIEGAFDNINFNAIIEALQELQVPPTYVRWIHHMISNRYVTISFCGETIRRRVTKGCPQGGVLSPLLWNITLNTLLSRLGADSSFVQAFADDLVILIQGICPNTISGLAQSQLVNIDNWCQTNGLKLSELKTKVVLFTRRRNNTLPVPLKLRGNTINQSNEAVYLGVTFDAKLSWVSHISTKVNKGINMLFACSKAVGKTWGLNPVTSRWIFNLVILPSVTYAAFVWAHVFNTNTGVRNLFDKLQRLAALQITRGLGTTPTANLEIMAGLQPLDLLLQETAVRTALRLKINNRWNSNYHINLKGSFDSHAYYTDKIAQNLPITSSCFLDRVKSSILLDRRYKHVIPPRTDFPDYINQSTGSEFMQVFTDGSKRNGLAGAGYCIFHNSTEIQAASFQLGEHTTVFQGEVFAILQAATWLLSQHSNQVPSGIVIFIDSISAIQALSATSCSSHLVSHTSEVLNNLGITTNILLSWVPGHSDIPGNERADELAREGSSTRPIGPEPFLPFPDAAVNNEINTYFHKKHISRYKKHTYSEKGMIPLLAMLETYKYKLMCQSKHELKQLTWLYSGHSPLRYFQFKIGRESTEFCEYCPTTPETSQHFLCECYGHATTRLNHTGHITMTWKQVSECKPTKILNFIQATGRLNQDRIFQYRSG